MMIEYSARSHVGRIRGNNEDNLYVDGVFLAPGSRDFPFLIDGCTSLPSVFAVCDGMGGEENGEVASLIAVQTLLSANEAIKTSDTKRLEETIQSLINDINEFIRSDALTSDRRAGTTIAIAVVNENGIHCFNIGDSRIYALYRGNFTQITNDHTPDGKAGSKLTRCIGIGDEAAIESYPPLPLGSRIMVCSDGLTDMVNTAEIENILRVSVKTANVADNLLNTALTNGGKDNITVIVADIKGVRLSLLRRFAKNLKGKANL